MKIRIVMLVIILAAVGAVLIGKNSKVSQQAGPSVPEVQYQAEAFTLPDLAGQNLSLESFQGKPVVLNFWATWCPPCQEETPDLVAFYEQNKDQLGVIGVNVTAQDEVDKVKTFIEKYSVTYPVVLDEKGAVSKTYRIQALPTTFILNDKGTIVYKKLGAVTSEELKRVLQPLLP